MSRTQLLQCPECGGSYRNAGALAKHLRSFHDLKIVDHKSRTHRKNKLSFLEEMEMDKKEKEGRIPSHFTALLDEAIKEVKLIRERLQAQRG